MTYTFTEKKRIRKDFGKLPEIMQLPYLLSTQLESYSKFLQRDVAARYRQDVGLHAAFRSVFPIVSYSGNAALEYVDYRLGEPVFDVKESVLRATTFAAPLRVKVQLIIYDRESSNKAVKDVKEQEVYMGEVPLMTGQRHVHRERHRAGRRFRNCIDRRAFSSITTAARRTPPASFFTTPGSFPTAAPGSTSNSIRKISSSCGSTAGESCRQRSCFRALGYSSEDILTMFFDMNVFHFKKDGYSVDLVPERMRGEVASFDMTDRSGNVIVESGPAHHGAPCPTAGKIRSAASGRSKREYLVGRVLARDVVDPETGEIIVPCNTVIDDDMMDEFGDRKVKTVETIYTNDLDCGSYISDTLGNDVTRTQLDALVEIYRMMRPGEPPTKEAAENLFRNLFFSEERYDLSAVGRMKFNRRLGRDEISGSGTLANEDIVEVLRTLIDIRNGKGSVDDIDHLGNRRVRSVGEMAEKRVSASV